MSLQLTAPSKRWWKPRNTFHTLRFVGNSVIFTFACRKIELFTNEFLLFYPTAVLVFGEPLVCGILGLQIGPVLHLLIIACEKNRHWICALETSEAKSNQFQSHTLTQPWKTSEQRSCHCPTPIRPCAPQDWHVFCTLRSVLSGFLSCCITRLNVSFKLSWTALHDRSRNLLPWDPLILNVINMRTVKFITIIIKWTNLWHKSKCVDVLVRR